ncbi:MAG: hypothetical protein ACE5HJ_03785 [Thermoplasmata archaeon]
MPRRGAIQVPKRKEVKPVIAFILTVVALAVRFAAYWVALL